VIKLLSFFVLIYKLNGKYSMSLSPASSLFRTLLHQSIIGYSRAHQPSLAEHLFKLAVLTYRSIHSTSPSYLQSSFTRVADMTSRRRLRSSASHRLEVPPVLLSTVGKRAFCSCRRQHVERPSAPHHIHITSAQSLAVFRQRLKTFLFFSFLSEHP